MKRQMKLKGRIFLEQDKSLRFESTVYDGQAFSVKVTQFDVQLGGAFKPSKQFVDGFLFCDCEAQQGDVCYLTLPKPTINFGKQVTVKEHLLQPRSAKLDDFQPSKRQGAVPNPVKSDGPKQSIEDFKPAKVRGADLFRPEVDPSEVEDTIGDLEEE